MPRTAERAGHREAHGELSIGRCGHRYRVSRAADMVGGRHQIDVIEWLPHVGSIAWAAAQRLRRPRNSTSIRSKFDATAGWPPPQPAASIREQKKGTRAVARVPSTLVCRPPSGGSTSNPDVQNTNRTPS